MRRFVTLCAALLLATAASAATTTYGDGVNLTSATSIQDLLTSPDQFVGKQVRVDGTVSAVCEDQGCWLDVSDPESGASVRVKVEDGVIVFPTSAKGARVSAQGVFEKVAGAGCAHHGAPTEADAEGHEGCARHAAAGAKASDEGGHAGCAKHAGETGKDSGATFRIRGTGAVITSAE